MKTRTVYEVNVFHEITMYEYVGQDLVNYKEPEDGEVRLTIEEFAEIGIKLWENNEYFYTLKEAEDYVKESCKLGHKDLKITVVTYRDKLHMTVTAENDEVVVIIKGETCEQLIELSNITDTFTLTGNAEGWGVGLLYLPCCVEVVVYSREEGRLW